MEAPDFHNRELYPMSLDFADLKPSLLTAVLFALYAMLVIPLLKFATSKYHIPGISELAAAI